ncbi:Short chain dehydrogenase citE [Sparassis crispa]|uniref:Short chain dehydrogenase citE n=1 Tax=Sparassis crispa TaxID=139825 RepID=A0A401H5J5_9APHY|nr:Short chain dehydrogenase citE [Sparassis crispa]GBE89717.1 Short chain dehydrogenase citE [Sparassis crispa]
MSDVTSPARDVPDFLLDPHNGRTFVPTAHHDSYPAIDLAKVDLPGKVVLVTGASKGIGKATALTFARVGVLGLVLVARSDMETLKAECLAVQRPGRPLKVLTLSSVDATDPGHVDDAARKVQETFGRLDVVINNAGFMETLLPIIKSDPNEWWKTWEVNVRGTFNVTRSFLPLLIESGGDKTIINMSSIAAHLVLPQGSAYTTSKLALLRFTECIMAEHGDQGVLAYAADPGAIATDMAKALPDVMQSMLIDTLELAANGVVWLARERRPWLAGRYVSFIWDVDELSAKEKEIVAGDKLKVKLVI